MKYALHDTEITKIKYNKTGIELYFDKGVYLLDEKGKEAKLSNPCRIIVAITAFDITKIYEHITVTKFRKSKVTDIEFAKFLKLLEKNSFCIDIDYYSFFGASILLKGYCGKYGIELTITEIENAEYMIDE